MSWRLPAHLMGCFSLVSRFYNTNNPRLDGELLGPQRKAVASTRAYGAMKPRRTVTFGSGVGPSRSTGSRRSRPGAGSPRASSRSSA